MKTRTIAAAAAGIALLLGLSTGTGQTSRERDPRDRASVGKPAGVLDRAQNVFTINRLGQTVTNLGQFYPLSGSTLPAGRWPLGTDHDQIYKMNFYVGVPGNVISTRANNVKEWDALPGYHNPDSGRVALSTDPSSWPLDGQGRPFWPIRTPDGRDSVLSQQDAFAVFKDLTNNRVGERLNILVRQTGYAWATSKDNNYVVFKFDIINDTTVVRDSLYFAMYCDFDAGGIVDDYTDDLWGLDTGRDFFYIYDADGESVDWEPGAKPFHLGMVFLETPEVGGVRPGLTDWHYSSDGQSPWGDVVEEDQVLYQWMSSDPALSSDPNWPNLFHGSDIKIDDPSLLRPSGQRLDAIGASGPYTLNPGETLTFICALVAGQDYDEISATVDRVRQIYSNDLRLIPPPTVDLRAVARDGEITLWWGNSKEFEYTDPVSGRSAVKEYRIYKTQDPQRQAWGDPVAVIPRDTSLTVPVDTAYRWTDPESTPNYFYYSYSVTTVDFDSLESGKAFLPADQTFADNTAELRPADSPRESLDAIKVVPNPYVISALWERKRLGDPLLGEPVRDMAFTKLPAQCTITIYTLDGDLIETLEHTNGTGTEYWDLRTSSNQLVTTGVYFFHVSSPVGERIGKFAIVR